MGTPEPSNDFTILRWSAIPADFHYISLAASSDIYFSEFDLVFLQFLVKIIDMLAMFALFPIYARIKLIILYGQGFDNA